MNSAWIFPAVFNWFESIWIRQPRRTNPCTVHAPVHAPGKQFMHLFMHLFMHEGKSLNSRMHARFHSKFKIPNQTKSDLGASHLSCCLSLLHLEHRPEKRRLRCKSNHYIYKENERKMKEIRKKWISFSGRWFPEVKTCFWEVYAWLAAWVKVGSLFFHQVGQIWVWWALV